jgi:hypothetical protein
MLVLLAAPALISAADRIRTNDGYDFYNFWGVTVARQSAGPDLGDPYRNGAAYLDRVKQFGSAADDAKLGVAAGYWHEPAYTGSPLLYMMFGLVPRDFTIALGLFQTLQVAAFVLAWLVLGRLYGIHLFSASFLAFTSLIAYQPFVSDLRVANLGSVQFALLAGLLAWARALRDDAGVQHRIMDAGLLAALGAFTLFKPNLALVAALLATHLMIRHGRKRMLPAAAIALGAAAGLLLLSCWYFGALDVWTDWYASFSGSNAHVLNSSVADGNYSTVALLSASVGASVSIMAFIVMALVVGSLVVVASKATDAAGTRIGWRAAVARIGGEPELAVCVGVALTLAISPLLWIHYYIITLVPALWLLVARPTSPWVERLAAVCIVLTSGLPGLLLGWSGWDAAMPVMTAVSWLPLWIATLIAVRAPREHSALVPAIANPEPARRA